MLDNSLPNKYNDQKNLTAEQLWKLINPDENPIILTNEEEKQLLDKIWEFSKFFYSTKSEIYKSKKQSEEKARTHFE